MLLCGRLVLLAESSTLPADTLTDDESEQVLMDELEYLADSVMTISEQTQGGNVQSSSDRELLDWTLSWLDTTECHALTDFALVSDSDVAQQLYELPTTIDMTYNAVVRMYINMYLLRRPRQVAALQRVGDYYFPLFDDKLCQYELPYELKYLPVIESALNASARSHAGAAGLWQFMPSTARLYGLEVNSLVDERLDPYKATDAACRFLKSLYALYGDWHLVLAAYNCGPGNINKAMRRSGGKHDFWSIYPWLPRETRAYVPLFIAAVYAMTYASKYGICPEPIRQDGTVMHRDHILSLCNDTVHTATRQHLVQTSEVLGLPVQLLRTLNPAYLKDVLPGGKDYTLVLPVNYSGPYAEYADSIVAYKADSLIHNRKADIDNAQKVLYDGTYSAGGVTYYKVKKGDTLGAIARRFRCTVAQLQRWNGMRNTNLQIGQKLKILK